MNLMPLSDMQHAFRQLFNLYAHELSQYNPWIGTKLNQHGIYLAQEVEDILNDSTREGYCIISNEQPVGFVIFSSDEESCSIDELFLVHTSRGKGIAEAICRNYWHQQQAICTLHVFQANKPAEAYWEKLITKCGYTFKKEAAHGIWVYRVKLS